MSKISVKCASCGELLKLPEQARGMHIHCSSCGQQIVVPRHPPNITPVIPPSPVTKETDEIPGIRRRFPAWLIPTLVAANAFLLLVLFVSFSYRGTEPVSSAPLIMNAGIPRQSAPPEKTNRAKSKSIADSDMTLTAQEIYRNCAPATVSIVGDVSGSTQLGSGFFVSSDGYLLTNHHVVKDALRVYIFTQDGTRIRALVKDSWPAMDLALLKVVGTSHPVISLADSDAVEIGASVVAIGTPQDLGLAQSITQGIISGRRLVVGVPCYQTSALINHGNSGGPLLNMRGEAVGIATFVMGTALVTPQGNIGSDVQGINFAVEINLARDFLSRNGVQFK